MLTDSIRNQTKQIFQNIEILLEIISKNKFDTIKGWFKTWKHFYYLVHSLDKNFIGPSNYDESEFHMKNSDIMNLDDNNILTKMKLILA